MRWPSTTMISSDAHSDGEDDVEREEGEGGSDMNNGSGAHELESLRWKLANSKRCPQCHIFINRDEGCNKCDCPYCSNVVRYTPHYVHLISSHGQHAPHPNSVLLGMLTALDGQLRLLPVRGGFELGRRGAARG